MLRRCRKSGSRQGIGLATSTDVIDLAGLASTSPPRLPRRRQIGGWIAVASPMLHMSIAILVAALATRAPHVVTTAIPEPAPPSATPRIVFIASEPPLTLMENRGGGGGGNGRSEPIRRAQGVGTDSMTLRVAKPLVPSFDAPPADAQLPGLLLDARPLASGTFDQIGLPTGGAPGGLSTGPGRGGGVGEGTGTGIGSGRGPGLGPGAGGGTGGGVYRPGGRVTSPRVMVEVRPTYTVDALERRVMGSVRLELVVGRDGIPTDIRVVGSLDEGLDAEAIKAVRQWRFAPGRLNGQPVDVAIVVMLDFRIH